LLRRIAPRKFQLVSLEIHVNAEARSGCPINLAMEELGDRWSLIIIRDMMFGNRRHFRELLTLSDEGIASNILSARMKRLQQYGFITAMDDPTHKQKVIYSLTEKAIQLVPVIVLLGAWGRKHLAVTEDMAIRAELLEKGGPQMWSEFMDELRVLHLGKRAKGAAPPVLQRLTEAYLAVKTRRARKAR
jgi:DNA-binding HxlR family transcriptional regulator